MKKLLTLLASMLFITSILVAQPVITIPTNYTLVDETGIITITFTDTDNAGPSTYTADFTAVVGAGQLSGSTGIDHTVAGLVSAGVGPFTIEVPAATLEDNTVYTFTIDNTSHGVAGASSSITVSTGIALTAGTTTAPSSPTALAPAPDITWTDASGGFPPYDYDIYINDLTGQTIAGNVESAMSSTSPYATTNITVNNEDYFVYVEVEDASTTTAGYSEVSFITEIDEPEITAPTTTTYDESRTPTITWNYPSDGGAGAVSFEIQISDDSFASTVYTASGATSGDVVGSSLDWNTDYKVRVVASKGGESKNSTTDEAFKTLLPTPTLDSPIDDVSVTQVEFGSTILLDWSISTPISTGDLHYDVYSGQTGSAAVVSGNQTHGSGTSYLYTPTALGMHDWYVVAKDQSGADGGNNTDKTSATETYEVLFGLETPVNSISGVSLTPLFEWDDAGGLVTGTDFDIEIDDDPAFGSINYTIDVVSGDYTYSSPTYSYQSKEEDFATPMSNNSKYYWRVKDNTNTYKSVTYYFYTVDDVSVSLSAPGDGAAVYLYDPLQFSWYLNQPQGSLRFMLQIKDTSAAPGAHEWDLYSDFEYDHISSIYRSVNGLDGGTRYYWRVVAYFDDGSGTSGSFDWGDRVVKYSSVFYFDTQGGAVTAYPSWPVGGNLIYNLSPTFYWYTLQYEPSATYEVLYSTTSTTGGSGELTTGVTTISAGSNIYVNIGATLVASTDYYWQVKTSYTTTSGTEVKYSSVAEFTTYDAPGMAPTAATPSYPTGGVEIYTQSPTFYWYIGGYNVDVNFTVEVDDDPGFGSVDFTFGTTQSTYIQGSGLIPGTTYHWRVVSSKSGYTSVPGPSATFSVAGGLGTSVVLSWPTGNPLLYSATPTLSWYLDGSSLGWSNYVVRWKEGSSPTMPTGWGDGGDYDDSYPTSSMTETYYTFTSALEYGSKYYWAVALDKGTALVDGDFVESSFTIAGGAASAGIVQTVPANNSTDIGLTPTFYWYVGGSSLGIDKYKVTYSNTELFTANVVEVVSTSTYASASSLDPGTTYWWYVSVSYDGGATYTPATSSWKFTTAAGLSAVMPLVGSPANGASVSTTSPVLSWYLPTQSSSALSYEVELADNAEFNNAEVYSNISQLSSQVSSLSQGEYYWRVKSTTGNSTSNYSNVGRFKLGDGVTSVDDGEEIPLSFSIDQNYPNPFNPSTRINYSIPTNSFVSIKIYDMLGQEVNALVNQEIKAGRHTLNWNGDNNYGYKVSSGTYIYRITAGNFVQSKKMILLK